MNGGVPAVGVEASTVDVSAVETYRRHRLSIVDNVDGRMGRVALAVLLAGGRPGHYGVKNPDDVVPPIEPVALPVRRGG